MTDKVLDINKTSNSHSWLLLLSEHTASWQRVLVPTLKPSQHWRTTWWFGHAVLVQSIPCSPCHSSTAEMQERATSRSVLYPNNKIRSLGIHQLHQKPFCTIQTPAQEEFRYKSPSRPVSATTQNLAFTPPVECLCPRGDAIHVLTTAFNRRGSVQELLPPRRATTFKSLLQISKMTSLEKGTLLRHLIPGQCLQLQIINGLIPSPS